jgi:predicted GIY-YIG superfamily endonuclease
VSHSDVAFFMHYVYVIQSSSTGRLYAGQTADLERHLQQHDDPSNRLTLHTVGARE